MALCELESCMERQKGLKKWERCILRDDRSQYFTAGGLISCEHKLGGAYGYYWQVRLMKSLVTSERGITGISDSDITHCMNSTNGH